MQNGIIPIHGFQQGLPYIGGFCKWWYVPIQHIDTWYPINLVTQKMETEPLLKTGKVWFGPLRVPNKKLGWEESQEAAKAGIFYKQKVTGFHPGDNGANRILHQNMPYYKYAIVGKLRAGGQYIIIGSQHSGLKYDHTFKTGDGGSDGTAGTTWAFTGESTYKAPTLPTFQGGTSDPDFNVTHVTVTNPRPMEQIDFTNVSQVVISWNSGRIALFGTFPLIEVWINDGINPIYLDGTASITVNTPPPATTTFTINLSGNTSGFIIIK